MRKIIFLISMIAGMSILSGYKISTKTEETEKHAKTNTAKDSKDIKKSDVRESKTAVKSSAISMTTERRPKILLMLTNDTGLSKWSPSLWWNYKHANPVQPGC